MAVLVRSGIPHTAITGLDESLEIIGLKIEASEVYFDFFSLYNPPNRTIPYDFFTDLEKNKTSFILVGDINAKSKTIGCNSNNISGDVLENIPTRNFRIHKYI